MDGNNQSGGEPTKQSAESGPEGEATLQHITDIVKEADLHTLSPDQRATRVWEALKKSPDYDTLSTWDIVCFAGNGVAMFHTFHPWLEEAARNLAQLMNTIHYANWEAIVEQEKENKLNRK